MRIVLSIALFLSVSNAQAQLSWNQWRGSSRDGYIANHTWPASLDADHLKQLWRIEAGLSYSGPVTDERRVYITSTRSRKTEHVRAIDKRTGKELWSASWDGAMEVPFFAKANGDWIRSTPATDGKRLYVAGMRDVLVCLDCESGKELWRYDFPKQKGSKLPSFGFVCSPLVHGNAVYVQAGEGFAKLKAETGELQWIVLQDGGGMFGSAFSSPYLCAIEGQTRILVQTRKELAAVNPDNGSVEWSKEIPAFRGMNIVTPTVWNDQVLTSSYGGATWLIDPHTNDGAPAEVWKNRAEGYMSSPVIVGDHVYLHLKNERLTCLDLKTGEATWTTRPLAKYCSLATDGKSILALTQDGRLMLIKANPEKFQLLSERKVSESETWAHIAVDADKIFVRDLQGLTCFEWK